MDSAPDWSDLPLLERRGGEECDTDFRMGGPAQGQFALSRALVFQGVPTGFLQASGRYVWACDEGMGRGGAKVVSGFRAGSGGAVGAVGFLVANLWQACETAARGAILARC